MFKRAILLISFVVIFSSLASAAILFQESFDNNSFSSRGWFDATNGIVNTSEHVAGSIASFQCTYPLGQTQCQGTGTRHMFSESDSVYLSYYVKYSSNWVGSGRPYHPHEFHFITNADNMWIGPSSTHLTLYIEQVGGTPRLGIQDNLNNDNNCILLNDNSFIGCNGNFSTYVFTENRSVASCNGLIGSVDIRDCFSMGGGNYYSSRLWDAPMVYFQNNPGPYYKNDWHFVEAYFKLNDIIGGVGVNNGKIQYWYDGQLVLDYQDILFRTAQHPSMRFNEFIMAPYIGDGSPVTQTMWLDNLTVATVRPGTQVNSSDVNSDGRINIIDLAIVVYNQGRSPVTQGYGHLDINGDGGINFLDVLQVIFSI